MSTQPATFFPLSFISYILYETTLRFSSAKLLGSNSITTLPISVVEEYSAKAIADTLLNSVVRKTTATEIASAAVVKVEFNFSDQLSYLPPLLFS